MKKKLYKGTFNYFGQDIIMWTGAKTGEKAYSNFITNLADVLGRSRGFIDGYFRQQEKDNYLIEEKKRDEDKVSKMQKTM